MGQELQNLSLLPAWRNAKRRTDLERLLNTAEPGRVGSGGGSIPRGENDSRVDSIRTAINAWKVTIYCVVSVDGNGYLQVDAWPISGLTLSSGIHDENTEE